MVVLLVVALSISVFAEVDGIIGRTFNLTEEGQGTMEITVIDESNLTIHVIFEDGTTGELSGTYTLEGDVITVNAAGGELGKANIVGDTFVPIEVPVIPGDTEEELPAEDMIDLYEWWQEYKNLEGDTPLEKGVDFFFKHKGDVGGIAAAIAVLVIGAILLISNKKQSKTTESVPFKAVTACAETIGKGLEKFDKPVKSTEEFLKLVPEIQSQLKATGEALAEAIKKNTVLEATLAEKAASDAKKSRKLEAILAYQAEVFADIIAMTALPADSKEKILTKYKALRGAAEK